MIADLIFMRMWNVDPRKMCRNHLLGEHLEMHMFAGSIRKGVSIKGYVEKGLVDVNHIKDRHDELADEMGRRGYCHKSPLKSDFLAKHKGERGKVDKIRNIYDLKKRCRKCQF